MKPNEANVEQVLANVLHSTPVQEMEAAAGRVLRRLRTEVDHSIEDASVQRSPRRLAWALSLASAVVVVMIIASVSMMQKRSSPQVATSPRMESRPVSEEIAGSRHAAEQPTLQQQAAPRPSRLEFAAVSIKLAAPLPSGPVNADTLKGRALGLGCHGTDGLPRSNFGGGPIQVPQGRCVADWVTVANLMNFAYASPWRYGPGIPEWAQHSDDERSHEEHFQIDGAADDPATATTAELRQMLQTMLADRFKLKIHRETQQLQRYVIRVARNSPNLKEASGEVEPPRFGPGIGGKSSLDELARFLTQFIISFSNLGYLDAPIVNGTGLTGIYEYQFRLSRSAAGGGPRGQDPGIGGPPSRSARLADTLVAISDGMESQIGLRLEPEKISAEVIVIDQIEKPSPN